MACGTPVIATNWSGPTEYITAENGYLIEVQDMIPAGCVVVKLNCIVRNCLLAEVGTVTNGHFRN